MWCALKSPVSAQQLDMTDTAKGLRQFAILNSMNDGVLHILIKSIKVIGNQQFFKSLKIKNRSIEITSEA